jgi:ABC-type Mn2+/Zn2+ transport system permease subunit
MPSIFTIWADPQMDLERQAVIAVVAVAVVCSLLSVLVVLKRMAFIGQGVSHAGFGGYGLALFIGWTGAAQQSLILAFCLATALGIGYLVRRRKVEADAAIGILLVAGMALGVLLQNLRIQWLDQAWYREMFNPPTNSVAWETLLFGSPWTVGADGMWVALVMAGVVIAVGAAVFKEMIFFCFDEGASRAFGVRNGVMYYLLLIMLAVVVVLAMRMVGFILVSAMLVIPGAAAMQLSRSTGPVFVGAVAVGVLGAVGGLALALEMGRLSPGACVVAALVAVFAVCALAGGLMKQHA